MKKTPAIITVALAGFLSGACTEHRRDTAPTPDGDTIEVTLHHPAPDLPTAEE